VKQIHMEQNIGKKWGIQSRACSKCGGDLGSRYGKQRYCCRCHAEYMRLHRPKHSELSQDARIKANVRAVAKYYLKIGEIKVEGCLACGKKAEMHHHDYSKPKSVIWLCREHHLLLHNSINKKAA
jgi:hypothetical protein